MHLLHMIAVMFFTGTKSYETVFSTINR